MTLAKELWIDRSNLRQTKVVEADIPAIGDGEVLVAIDKFGLTANNVSYAVSGDTIGYWGFYPAPDNWGKVPVWGCADVIESKCDEIPVGERMWGFFPMASHTVLRPGRVVDDQFVDFAAHRKELPGLYNGYRRTKAEPEFIQQLETERCLLFPLFMTSYVLYDYLLDNDFFGAQQVLIGSVSSKTGFGLAKILKDDPKVSQKVVGLTSAGNVDFVKELGCCDQIVTYGNESEIDATLPAAYVDMSGDAKLTATLHKLLQDNMVESCMVGATHWEEMGSTKDLPGAKPTFFFAPGQIDKRNKEWGPGIIMMKGMMAGAEIAKAIEGQMTVEWTHDADALAKLWVEMLDNKIAPTRGQMVSLLSA